MKKSLKKFVQIDEFVDFLSSNKLTDITTPRQEKNGTIHVAFLGKKKAGAGCYTPATHKGFTIHSNGYVRSVKGLSAMLKKYPKITTKKEFVQAIDLLQTVIDKRKKKGTL